MFNAYSIAKPNIQFISYTTIVSLEAAPTEVESIEKAKVGFLRCGVTFVTQTDVWLSTGGVRDAVCLLPYKVHDLWTRAVSEEHWKTSADPRQMLMELLCVGQLRMFVYQIRLLFKSLQIHIRCSVKLFWAVQPLTLVICQVQSLFPGLQIYSRYRMCRQWVTCMSLLNSHHLQFLTRKLWFRV